MFVTKFAGKSLQNWSSIFTLSILSALDMFYLLMKTIDLFHSKVFVIFIDYFFV